MSEFQFRIERITEDGYRSGAGQSVSRYQPVRDMLIEMIDSGDANDPNKACLRVACANRGQAQNLGQSCREYVDRVRPQWKLETAARDGISFMKLRLNEK